MYLFSPSTLGFYPIEMKEEYLTNGSLPSDVIEVSDSVRNEYNFAPPEGKQLSSSQNMPVWIDIPPATREELIADAEREKLRLKAVADDEISWRQDAVDAGIATAEETAALSEWKKYRVMLMRVDIAKPVWPTPPGEKAS
ncbi:tail fiber assembly protein [Enterobacter hormaechei]|uniref:tail fiber assembly protein n=1 Tax=Enterobacter cloacae complex TaxID=354276 RepID=UPI0006D959EA|nr:MULTISPECIES: tail fiber assembly protein [Enterobacter cloacae complex]ELY2059828.1 tail fiber assembly protein [Enterobacter hormaechei]ELY2067411.1 tail fiber assembly protein [Enterobacter hormaechei]MCC9360790.1 tail fiber assembly protein [Enterobacter hormaechei subsp. xiangfangensis]MCE1547823.1 tail fiber assembly protein [Enterobacter hormaechei]MCF2398206.1 tail fiber assembly protein [Enterobacter hormaechei subsp. xiangfangensis]